MSDTVPAPVRATPWRIPSPSIRGFSSTRLAQLHSALQRHVDNGSVPGIVALVARNGVEHIETLGKMAFGSDAPMRRDTIFRLASTTKPITAVAAMILVEQCRLRLDDPVEQWLPELKDRRVLRAIDSPLDDTVPANRPITLRDLLTFRSGYGEIFFVAPNAPLQQAMIEARLPLSAWPFEGTGDDLMRRLGKLPLAAQPGEGWFYHMSAEILGVLIARVSGMSLGDFMRERIFEPLGMADTGFHVPPSSIDRLPVCYGLDLATGALTVLDDPKTGCYSRIPRFESGAGGLVSTVDDLLAFGRMMLGEPVGCGERILSRPSIELMTRDQLTPDQKAHAPFFEHFWETHGWGLGMGVITGRKNVSDSPGRFGWDGAFGTSCWVDPKRGLVGILMTQRRPDQLALPPVVLDFWTSVYQLLEE